MTAVYGALHAGALDYARRGWPVFPLRPKGKVPLLPTAHPAGDPLRGTCKGECGRQGHGLYDATTDAETVDKWWRTWPAANVGLRTGVAFDVLDVDHGHGGFTTLARLVAEHGCLFSGGVVTTGGGGAHYLFAPTGHGNRTDLGGRGSGLDWRGRGGYVVAPPSIHPNGRAYFLEWIDAAMPPAPAWLVDLITGPAPATATTATTAVRPRDRSGYGRRALEAEIGRVAMTPAGGRNHAVNTAAFNLGQLVGGGVLGLDEVIDALVLVGRSIGLEDAELEPTIRSGLAAGLATPRSAA